MSNDDLSWCHLSVLVWTTYQITLCTYAPYQLLPEPSQMPPTVAPHLVCSAWFVELSSESFTTHPPKLIGTGNSVDCPGFRFERTNLSLTSFTLNIYPLRKYKFHSAYNLYKTWVFSSAEFLGMLIGQHFRDFNWIIESILNGWNQNISFLWQQRGTMSKVAIWELKYVFSCVVVVD